MKITASMIAEFAALGLTAEQMAGVAAVVESGDRDRLRKDRERKRNSLEFHGTDRNSTERSDTVSPKEIPPTPPKEITPSTSEAKASSVSIRDALATVLDAEHVNAVIAHRKAKRAPLTLRAAELLAKDFAAVGNPNDNADEMIRRGWTAYKPEWVRDRATGPPRPNFAPNATNNGNDHERPATNAERNLASLARIRGKMGQAPGNRQADEQRPAGSVELLPPSRGEPRQFTGR